MADSLFTGGARLPGDPKGQTPATDSFEIKHGRKRLSSGMYVYTCPGHYDQGARFVAPPQRKNAA